VPTRGREENPLVVGKTHTRGGETLKRRRELQLPGKKSERERIKSSCDLEALQ